MSQPTERSTVSELLVRDTSLPGEFLEKVSLLRRRPELFVRFSSPLL